VPLDPCGNLLPAATAPAAASRPVVAPTSASVPVTAPAPAEPAPTKTFSDKPADAAPQVSEGWAASNLEHVDPKKDLKQELKQDLRQGGSPTAEARQVEKPDTASPAGQVQPHVEPIPAPPAKEPAAAAAPTVAPPGPVVYPPPPANDTRDVPAAETSGRGFSADRSHTT